MSGSVPFITQAVLDELWAHAAAGYPEEVCGLLLGSPGTVDEARRCENRQNALHAEDPINFQRGAGTAYNIGARDLFFLEKSRRTDRPVQIIYHSHINVGAYFSVEDRAAATIDGELIYPVDYLVIDAQADGARGARLFRFEDGVFAEIAAYTSPTKPRAGESPEESEHR